MPGAYYSDAEIAALSDSSLLKHYASQIYTIASQCSPYPSGTQGFLTFLGECQAWLPTRKLTYFKKTPGDCPPFVTTGYAPVALGPQGGGVSLQISGAVAKHIPVPGAEIVGDILGFFSSIVHHHEIAVADEQATLCNISGAFENTLPQLDYAVAYGIATPAQAIDAMTQMVAQLDAVIDSKIKDKQGNSGSNYKGIMAAHIAFARILYPDIYPGAYIAAPGQPSSTAPANANQAIAGFTSSLGIGQGSPIAAVGGLSWTSIALIAAVGIAVILLVKQ